jgi:diguanylate cyclase (GGDEF)-like protein
MYIDRILARVERQPRWLLLSECLLLTVSEGVLDYVTGDFSLLIFYLIPIFLSAWFLGRTPGLAIALLCGMELFITNLLHSPKGISLVSIRAWNSLMEALFLLLSAYMLLKIKNELEVHKNLALTDSLTGVLNRRSFYELAEYEVKKSRRYGRLLTMVYIDLDDFKTVNDSFGHARGDLLLRSVATTIREELRGSDIVARVGGDEFAVLLAETGEESSEVLKKLRSRLNTVMAHHGGAVTASIGAVTFRFPPASVDEMVHLADKLMYRIKHSGKDRVGHVTHDGGEQDDR